MHVDSELVQHFSIISVGEADYSDASLVKTWDHVCSFCSRCGPSQHGLTIHTACWCGEAQRKVHEKDFEVENILQARGSVQHRFYEVQRKGFAERTWEPARYLDLCAAVEEFWAESSYSVDVTFPEQAGEHRCHFCNWFGKRRRDLKSHWNRGCASAPRSKAGSKAEAAVKKVKAAKMHSQATSWR